VVAGLGWRAFEPRQPITVDVSNAFEVLTYQPGLNFRGQLLPDLPKLLTGLGARYAVRPMLAVRRGRMVALSTPFGKRGWLHDEWFGTGEWGRVKITAPECPRISAGFLAEEERALGERWYRQEYLCSFEDVVDAVFAYEDIQAAMSDAAKPLFGE
jgi:hypothetical protein